MGEDKVRDAVIVRHPLWITGAVIGVLAILTGAFGMAGLIAAAFLDAPILLMVACVMIALASILQYWCNRFQRLADEGVRTEFEMQAHDR